MSQQNFLRLAMALERQLEEGTEDDNNMQSTRMGTDDPAVAPSTVFVALMTCYTVTFFLSVVLFMFLRKENALIRRYKTEGNLIEADVTSCTCARRYVGQQEEDVDYLCVVEYDVIAQDDEESIVGEDRKIPCIGDARLRFQKQIKVKSGELFDVQTNPIPTKIQVKKALFVRTESAISFASFTEADAQPHPSNPILAAQTQTTPKSSRPTIARVDTMKSDFHPSIEIIQQIHLLVLPEEPQSGYSQEQVQRRGSFKFQWPLFVSDALLFVVSMACLYCAAQEAIEIYMGAWVLPFVLSLVVCFIVIGFAVRRTEPILTLLVENEYFKLMDHMIMAIHRDSSSITTRATLHRFILPTGKQ